MRHQRPLTAFATLVISFAAMAQYHGSPELALSEYIAAYKARDVDRFIAAIDLAQEAREQLRKEGVPQPEPTNTQVQVKTLALAKALRDHFAKFGFRAETLDNCRSITKFQDSESQARIVLSCTDSHGSSTFPVRILRFESGWRVVRGG